MFTSQGQHVSFSQQIQQFTDTVQHFILHMGEDSTRELISQSVVYISIGVNDYIHYYLQNESGVQNLFLPWGFAQFLASNVKQEIKVFSLPCIAPFVTQAKFFPFFLQTFHP